MTQELSVEDAIRSGMRMHLSCVIALRKAVEDGHLVYAVDERNNRSVEKFIVTIWLTNSKNHPLITPCMYDDDVKLVVRQNVIGNWQLRLTFYTDPRRVNIAVINNEFYDYGFIHRGEGASVLEWNKPEEIPLRVKQAAFSMYKKFVGVD